MEKITPPESAEKTTPKPGLDALFGVFLFAIAVIAMIVAISQSGTVLPRDDWGVALFFLIYGLFTITMGYPHPSYGHVSFDRVAQVASILVLGPVPAALINGLASLLYPWHRIFKGVSVRSAAFAAFSNSGLMTIMILVCGSLYTTLGGPVPLMRLDWNSIGLLLMLMLSMQIVNDLLMLVYVYLRGHDPKKHFNLFSSAVELSSVVSAVLVALIFNRMEMSVFILLLSVLSLGMLVLKQLANMRHHMETLVEERTQELNEKSLELERQATHDTLTDLYNRRFADDYLEKAIAQSKREDEELTIALADIDFFKEVNDQYSHAKGDEVLVRVAALLRDRCRASDMIARYGGEEFLLCFPKTDSVTASKICEQLRLAIEKEDWSFIAPNVKITLSFGIAENFSDFRRKTILSAADSRLYEAKNNGRNRVVA